jgi:hypothetical protein
MQELEKKRISELKSSLGLVDFFVNFNKINLTREILLIQLTFKIIIIIMKMNLK